MRLSNSCSFLSCTRKFLSESFLKTIKYQTDVSNCSNVNDSSNGISLHRIPFWSDKRPEAKKRKLFVQTSKMDSIEIIGYMFGTFYPRWLRAQIRGFRRKRVKVRRSPKERRYRNFGYPFCLPQRGRNYVNSWTTAGKMRLDIFFGQCGLVVQTTL